MGREAKQAIPSLVEALKDEDGDVRISAAFALVRIKLEVKQAIPVLIEALKSEDANIRFDAAKALGAIGPEAKQAIPALVEALKEQPRMFAGGPAEALGRIGPEAVPALTEALKDRSLRFGAAIALSEIGLEAKQAMPALIEALKDESPTIRSSIARALGSIATALFDTKSTEALPLLREAYEALLADPALKDEASTVKRTIDYFETLWWVNLTNRIERFIQNHPFISLAIAAYLVLQLAWLFLFWRWPLLLLKIVTSLGKVGEKLRIPKLDIPVPVPPLLVFPLFYYRSRLLNAWVQHYLVNAKENFNSKQTVLQRKVYVALPVSINDKTCDSLSVASLQPTFNKSKVTVLVTGEGGTGKTSLACQMAIWAMQTDQQKRLYKTYPALSVLIESNLEPRIDGKDVLTEAVHGQLRDLIGETEPIFEELFIQLLRKGRVLVIVDSLSELNEATRKSLRPTEKGFPIAALVVTSRIEEDMGGAIKTTIRPLRLKSNALSGFFHDYLSQCGKRELFEDEEFFDGCRRLSQIVGGREITVLIAKMFAEQMVASKEETSDRELPRNLPDLMQGYIKTLNDQIKADKLDTLAVLGSARVVAVKCLEQTYRPAPAKIGEVIDALATDTDAKALLKYLEGRLRLIQTTGAAGDEIRFSLDPLAEYLTGLYLVETYRDDGEKWRAFIDYAQEQPGAPEAIKGFLLAVHDCCVEKGSEYRVPEKVKDELAKLAGLDQER
jgi:HEAT repeat protein